MTSRLMYEGVLIELHKENAPNILLEDFNYFANKAINLYINKRYNIYDINQQTTDDLRVLKATALLPVKKVNTYDGLSLATGGTYEVDMPTDYLHLLNCICIYDVKKTYNCYNAGDTWRAAATRLTADAYSQVLDNFWLKPTYKRPYYYIHNVNTNISNNVPTNPYGDLKENIYNDNRLIEIGTDLPTVSTGSNYFTYIKDNNTYYVSINNPSVHKVGGQYYINIDNTRISLTPVSGEIKDAKGIDIGKPSPEALYNEGLIYKSSDDTNITISEREKSAYVRYGNRSRVRLEIRYGTDDSVFKLKNVYVDYIKAPQYIRLTQEELDYTEDMSQLLEFPDYVCQEIINELVNIIMENISDLRLSTHPVVSLSIANPAQQLTQPAEQSA